MRRTAKVTMDFPKGTEFTDGELALYIKVALETFHEAVAERRCFDNLQVISSRLAGVDYV